MPPAKQGRKIAFVGATGAVGRPTLEALIALKIHTITVITRPDSPHTLPSSGIARVERGVASDAAFLAEALKGQDVLLLQLAVPALDDQKLFFEAAAKAGVGIVVPTDFGSDTNTGTQLIKEVPFLLQKKQYRDHAEKLGLGWLAIVNNPWFDWSLARGLWGIDIPNRKATLYDGGNVKFVTTNIGTVGKATAGLLSLPSAELAKFRNKPVYLQSYHTTQREVLASVLKATGTTEKDWNIEEQTSKEAVEKSKGTTAGSIVALYVAVLTEGWGGDYAHKVGNTPELLGAVEEESLDQTVARVVKELATSQK